MYTATIKSKEIVGGGRIHVTMTFSNGKDSFDELVGVTSLESFNHTVKVRLTQLNGIKDVFDQIQLGAFTPTTKEETPEGQAREAEKTRLSKLEEAKYKLDIKAITQEEYEALVTEIKSASEISAK